MAAVRNYLARYVGCKASDLFDLILAHTAMAASANRQYRQGNFVLRQQFVIRDVLIEYAVILESGVEAVWFGIRSRLEIQQLRGENCLVGSMLFNEMFKEEALFAGNQGFSKIIFGAEEAEMPYQRFSLRGKCRK